MKTKRFVSVLMSVVMMLSVIFCAVPTASASATPKVTFSATILANKVDGAYKVYQFNTYKVYYHFQVGNKSIYEFDKVLYRKNIVTDSKTVSANRKKAYICINGGKKELVRVYCSARVNPLKVDSFLWKIKGSKRYNSSEKKAIEKYVKDVAGTTIADNIYVIPQPFKAKTVSTSRAVFGNYVYVKFLTPCNINGIDYAIATNSSDVKFVRTTTLKNIGKVAKFRVRNPKSKSTYKINIITPASGFSPDDVHKTFKVKPYQFVKPGYILA